MRVYLFIAALVTACSAEETVVTNDFGFDGTCVNCHAGLSAAHVHPNYKLRCVDCHGGNDQVTVPADAFKTESTFRDQNLLKMAHVLPKAGLARFFFANGVDDDGDGVIDNPAVISDAKCQTGCTVDFGEVFEPNLHGEGAGEFLDTELQRDLNYTRFLNPGDLRVATIGCGASNRAAGAGGNAFGCHQQTIEIVRRSIMVNQAAVINGAYYGNESSRSEFTSARGNTPDPRAGAFSYALDYAGVDGCIQAAPAQDPTQRAQPHFLSDCLEKRATQQDPAVAANAPGNANLPAFEMAEGTIDPAPGSDPATTIDVLGAGDLRYPWGGTMIADTSAERAKLAPVPNGDVLPGIPDPVDNILRTFRAYYPLNYPGSTTNFNFTFGTSIEPDIGRFRTADAFGRGHSSGCTACHAQYAYDGSRAPTPVLNDDGTVTQVVDPTTKHREFDPATQDRGTENGQDRLIGRAVFSQEQTDSGRPQQKTYSQNHNLTTAITTDQCGLCHGFVTRINYAYQGMAEEEQRDQLSRRKELAFDTPNNTHVVIHDSWVREDNISGSPVVIEPADGLAVIKAAKDRDAMLAAKGFIAGNGGCAANVFTEDCNNNGELDHNVILTKVDEDGNVIDTITIDEDANGNGKLDLIDRLPRENSIDGRQMRYVYGGRNGSTRLMDIHFERGMHCIDCHFMQDVHGDGHLYSTNWDAIEIECEDCHGGGQGQTNLKTSGPNGGNDLTRAHDQNLRPYFEKKGGKFIQRSRVTPGLSWVIPQTVDQKDALATEAHQQAHVAAPGSGSTFDGPQGQGKLTAATLECATCHSSWIHNCVGCHVDLNIGDKQRKKVDATGHAVLDPGENEVWMSNANNAGHINFQLLGLLRAPFVLGVSSSSEKGRLATFRSSMQAHVTVSDATGDNILDNVTFTTFQTLDANSGRMNVATSGVAMNQTMPHTVRPAESRGCELCHPLVDTQGRVRNEHILAESYGLGGGVLPFVGDWAMAVGGGGLELYEYKAEKELAANNFDPPGASTRFPGMIVDPNNRTLGKVEPIFDNSGGVVSTSIANDIALIRNFNPTPQLGGTAPPTLRDLAVMSVNAGGIGKLVITDITGRGSRGVARQSVGSTAKTLILNLPAVPFSIAHIGPDVSDPFVYVAVGTSGISVARITDVPTGLAPVATIVRTVPLPGGIAAVKLALAGDLLYVGSGAGTIEVFSLATPDNPQHVGSATVGDNVTGLVVAGFMLYVSTPTFIAAFQLDDPQHPAPPSGTTSPVIVPGLGGRDLSFSAGHLYVPAVGGGVFDIDVRTPAMPVNNGNLAAVLAPSQPVNAADVIVSIMPGQTWLLALDLDGSLWGLKLDNRQSTRERCFPNPLFAGCLLDMNFLDATVSGRDPSFDPVTGTFDATDPSGVTFFHQTSQIIGASGVVNPGRRLARPTQWEQIGTLTGRRYRDSFMPGSGVLSLEVMQGMRAVQLCESPNAPSRAPGNLSGLGYADDAFKQTGTCQPLGISARTIRPRAPGISAKVCRPQPFGRTVCTAGERLASRSQ